MSEKKIRQSEPEIDEDKAGNFAKVRYVYGPADAAERMVLLHGPEWLERASRDAGRWRGRSEARREDVVEVLEHRFGKVVAAEFVQTVHAICDEETLKYLLRLALACEKVATFGKEAKRRARTEKCQRLIDETA